MTKLLYQIFSPTGLTHNKQLSHSSKLILLEAEKHGVNWKIIPGTQLVRLNYRGIERHYYHQVPPTTTAVGLYITTNKKITCNILTEAGISVPKGYRIKISDTNEYREEIFSSLKKPLVVKPSKGAWGDNITINISDFTSFQAAIELAFDFSRSKKATVVAEEMFSGSEYRILATQDKVIGIVNRIPANVVGDGAHTIQHLIKEKNKEPIRNKKNDFASHVKIRIDAKLRKYLEQQKLSLQHIPKKDETIFLRRISNISKGGDAIDYTDKAHPTVIDIALKATRAIPGLSFAGIDFMCNDITKPQSKDSYVIIEVNNTPGFDIHDYPYVGKKRNAAYEFLSLVFPEIRKEA